MHCVYSWPVYLMCTFLAQIEVYAVAFLGRGYYMLQKPELLYDMTPTPYLQSHLHLGELAQRLCSLSCEWL